MTIQHENYLLDKTTRRLGVMFEAMFALASCGGTSPERDQQGNRTHFDTTYEDLALCAMDAGVAPPIDLRARQKACCQPFPTAFSWSIQDLSLLMWLIASILALLRAKRRVVAPHLFPKQREIAMLCIMQRPPTMRRGAVSLGRRVGVSWEVLPKLW